MTEMEIIDVEMRELNKKKTADENKEAKEFTSEDGKRLEDLKINKEELIKKIEKEDYKQTITFYNKKGNKVHDDCHAASVVGDTVGDPLKDTSGPSVNILIKLSSIVSVIFGTLFIKTSFLIHESAPQGKIPSF